MQMAASRRWWLPALIFAGVIAADQMSKQWILENLGPNPLMKVIPIIDDWLRIVYWRNTGVAFGLFQNNSNLFQWVALLITAGAIYAYVRYLPNDKLLVQVSMGLILGGALGNVIDRIRLGYVVDFIQVGWWPIFNLADSAITVGATLLGVYLLFAPDEEPAAHTDPRDEHLLAELLTNDGPRTERSAPPQPPEQAG